MPDVLMLAQDDWANTGWRFFKCIQSLGVDILALKGNYHRMAYPEQIPIHPCMMNKSSTDYPLYIPELRAYAKDAKVIHFIASKLISPGVDLREKKVVMQHGGSIYRQNHEMINEVCNQVVDTSIIQCPDLLGLGAKNEHWIYYPVDTDYIKPNFKTNDKLKIGHFPSNPDVKGTAAITRVVERLEADPKYKNRFEYIGIRGVENVSWGKPFINNCLTYWKDNLKRLAECDMVIETMCTDLNGKTYGEWGNTALEAAALGKIVITNSLTVKEYKQEFGLYPLQIANSEKVLEEKLKEIFDYSNLKIISGKKLARAWVERNHSMPVTARRIWDKVYRDLL